MKLNWKPLASLVQSPARFYSQKFPRYFHVPSRTKTKWNKNMLNRTIKPNEKGKYRMNAYIFCFIETEFAKVSLRKGKQKAKKRKENIQPCHTTFYPFQRHISPFKTFPQRVEELLRLLLANVIETFSKQSSAWLCFV